MTFDKSRIDSQDWELLEASARIDKDQAKSGLRGLTGGLDHVIINTQPDRLNDAVTELLATTGLVCTEAFEDESATTYVLTRPGSADFLLRARKADKPFRHFNQAPKARHLPDTRLETLVFSCADLKKYTAIAGARGVRFLSGESFPGNNSRFIQTVPSACTGISTGFIERSVARHRYQPAEATELPLPSKPDLPYLPSIGRLDHVALRVTAGERTAAITEFMELTGYRFSFAIYVRSLNSITSVTRVSPTDFALVFTSGIPGESPSDTPGPTEQFVRNYGKRAHHMAFDTSDIEETFTGLRNQGVEFMLNLAGSESEGLKQTFTQPSPHTLLVTEYIHRYGAFDGFFTRSNVEVLTRATAGQ
ncbi:conserved hypothetical protein [Dehalogenimonas lykanthroporepellens BL-DC-9]|nr:conserved hypothetical protein [Dehalogenimonas lykanthroporepellens BL-DC-9]